MLKGGSVKCEFPSLRSAGEAHIVGRRGAALPNWHTVPMTHQSHVGGPHTTTLWSRDGVMSKWSQFQHGPETAREQISRVLIKFIWGNLARFFPCHLNKTKLFIPLHLKVHNNVMPSLSSEHLLKLKDSKSRDCINPQEKKSNH